MPPEIVRSDEPETGWNVHWSIQRISQSRLMLPMIVIAMVSLFYFGEHAENSIGIAPRIQEIPPIQAHAARFGYREA